MLEVLREYGVTSPAEVIPTGLEPESFMPGDGVRFRERYGIAPERPMMLFVGRVAHEKNIGFLLRVLQHVRLSVPGVLFVIAGEGPARDGLEREVEQLGLAGSILFIGYLDRHTELNDCYRSADVFVFSSRTETQGLVLLEAMAQGVPVVSTAKMGTRDVLKDGAGVLIAEEEVEDFSGKVARLLGSANARTLLGQAGREYAAQWSAGSMAERMLQFYQTAITRYKA
jgi:glycosyltransferase involved in cell wall biosynthesis